MVVMCPADDVEAKAAVRAAVEHEGPVYMRFGRAASPVINDTFCKFRLHPARIFPLRLLQSQILQIHPAYQFCIPAQDILCIKHREIGKGQILREGTDVTIVATGICVGNALEAICLSG